MARREWLRSRCQKSPSLDEEKEEGNEGEDDYDDDGGNPNKKKKRKRRAVVSLWHKPASLHTVVGGR